MFAGWLREQLTGLGMQELSGEEIVAQLTPDAISQYLDLYDEELWEQKHRKFANLFPDEFRRLGEGEWSDYYPRHLYPRHMEFFKAGAIYDERCFMAGNRVGKTVVGGYETTCHLTGKYPAWWEGRRFRHPIRAIAAGKTNETTRDIVQQILLGLVTWRGNRKTMDGSGIIPTELIGRDAGQLSWKQGSPDLVDTVKIRHVSGGFSKLALKSYQQGRGAFEGTAQHLCIAEGSLVQMMDGTLRQIERVLPGEMVLGVDHKGVPGPRRVTAVHVKGERECVRVEPRQGSHVIATPDHDLFWGYRYQSKAPAAEATRVAQLFPGCFWPEVTEARAPAWYVWAALAVAEGSTSQRKITNGDEASMEKAIELLPPDARVRKKGFAEHHEHVPDWYLYWDGFWQDFPAGKSHEKSIPDWVFRSSKEDVALFLRWLYMGDGWAYGKAATYATTSEKLATQLGVLLNRLGFTSTMRVRRSPRAEWRDQYWVGIQKSQDVAAFLRLVGMEGKQPAVGKVLAEADRRVASKVARSAHLAKDEVLHDREWIAGRRDRAKGKVAKVSRCSDAGTRPVYDLSVEGEHRFFVGTALVSNCWVDEEPELEVYDEARIRTMTTKGITMLTYTPLEGLTDTVLSFLPAEMRPATNEVLNANDWGNWNG